jgi:hypothetical protein
MTLVIALKVGDGVVLGADSASTITDSQGKYYNSYFNSEKLFNLRKGLPIGAVTFGLGGLKGRSVGSLTKDLRLRFSDPAQPQWYLDPQSYTLATVADGVRKFFFDELYQPEFGNAKDPPVMGFYVAGYSAKEQSAEIWCLNFRGATCEGPIQTCKPAEPWSMRWDGVSEALYRIMRGWSQNTLNRLKAAGMAGPDAVKLLDAVQPMVHPTMPIQDAIDLVHYLMDVTIGFVRFSPGEATVAQPIDSAAITRHEGFKWVRRKHYYQGELNP